MIFLHKNFFFLKKNTLFLLFKSAQVFVLPLRAVVAVIALVCAWTRAGRLLKDKGLFLYLFFTTFFYSSARLLFLSYLTEKVKQKQIDHKKSDKQVDQKKKQNAISNISTPNIKQVVYLSISISTAIYAIRSLGLLCQHTVSKQKRKQEDVKVDKESKIYNDQQNFD